MKIKLVILPFLAFLVMCLPHESDATSGACSSHSGVDCARGMQSDGRVYCNDGWTESSTYYEFTAKCQEQSGINEIEDIVWKQFRYDGKIVDGPILFNFNGRIVLGECPSNSSRDIDHANGIYYCICNDGYYNYGANNLASPNQTCTVGEPFVHMVILAKKATDKIIDGANRTSSQCRSRYINSYLDAEGDCQCKMGYRWVYDVYTKAVLCIKRDDYDTVIKSRTPDPLENEPVMAENNISIKAAEEVDMTAYGDIPDEEKILENKDPDSTTDSSIMTEKEKDNPPPTSEKTEKENPPSDINNTRVDDNQYADFKESYIWLCIYVVFLVIMGCLYIVGKRNSSKS